MYDFTYRSASVPAFGAFVPLKIEGAPDHGTIADAKVWAEYYEVRISLYDGRGRWLCDAHPDGKVIGVTQRLLDMLDRTEAAGRASRVAEKMRATGITREDATKLRAKWLEQYPEMRTYFGAVQYPISPAYERRMAQAEFDQVEARKRAWALGLDWQAEVDGAAETGESVATRVGRLWEIENTPSDDLAQLDQIYLSAPLCQRERAIATINARTQAPTCAQWVKFGEPRERSCYFIVRGADRAMSGKTAFLDDLAGLRRLQTDMRAFQVEQKQPKPARTRHLTGVSVDLLIAVGQIGGA